LDRETISFDLDFNHGLTCPAAVLKMQSSPMILDLARR